MPLTTFLSFVCARVQIHTEADIFLSFCWQKKVLEWMPLENFQRVLEGDRCHFCSIPRDIRNVLSSKKKSQDKYYVAATLLVLKRLP